MALSAFRLVPISELNPSLPTDTHYITGIVSIVWPYSSHRQSLSILLVNPDFRQRRNKGQVRISFKAASAKAVIKSGLKSSDELKLGLAGAGWREETDPENTPGKSVEWELEYGGRVFLQIERAGQEPVVLDVEDYAEESERSPIRFEANGLTPMAQKRKRESTDMYGVQITPSVYYSPAFMKKRLESKGGINRTGGDPFVDENDVFVDVNGDGKRKKPRFSRPSGAWTYIERSPSPTPAPLNGKEVVARIVTADVSRLAEGTSQQEQFVEDLSAARKDQAAEDSLPAHEEQNTTLESRESHESHDTTSHAPQPDPHNLLTEPSDTSVSYPDLPVSFAPEERVFAKEKSQSPNSTYDMSGYNPRLAGLTSSPQRSKYLASGSSPRAEPVPEKMEKLTSATAIASYYEEVDATPPPDSKEEVADSLPKKAQSDTGSAMQADLLHQPEQSRTHADTPLSATHVPDQLVESSTSELIHKLETQQNVSPEQPENTVSGTATPYHESNGMTPYAPPSLSPGEKARVQRLYAAQLRKRELAEINRNALSAMQGPPPTPNWTSYDPSPEQAKEELRDRRVRFHDPAAHVEDTEMLDVEDSGHTAQASKPLAIDIDILRPYEEPKSPVEVEPQLPQSPKLEPLPSPGLPLVSPLTKRKTLPPAAYTKRLQNGDENDEDYEFEEDEDDDVSSPDAGDEEGQAVSQPKGKKPARADYADSFISNVQATRGSYDSEDERIEGEASDGSLAGEEKADITNKLESSSTTDLGDQASKSPQDGFQSQAENATSDEGETAKENEERLSSERRRPRVAQESVSPEETETFGEYLEEYEGAEEYEGEEYEGPWSPDRAESRSPVINGSIREVQEGDEASSRVSSEILSDSDILGDEDRQGRHRAVFEDDEDFGDLPPHSSDEAEEQSQEQVYASENMNGEDEALPRTTNAIVDAKRAMSRDRSQENNDFHDTSDNAQRFHYEMTGLLQPENPASESSESLVFEKGPDPNYNYGRAHEDDEEREYAMADADDEYEENSEDEVGTSSSKPIEVIDLDSGSDDVAPPASTSRGTTNVNTKIDQAYVSSDLQPQQVAQAGDQDEDEDDDVESERIEQAFKTIENASRMFGQESDSAFESEIQHGPARRSSSPTARKDDGDSEQELRVSSSGSYDEQASDFGDEANEMASEQGLLESSVVQNEFRDTLADSDITPEVFAQSHSRQASEEVLEGVPAIPRLAVEEISETKVIRPEVDTVVNYKQQVSATDHEVEAYAVMQTITELPQSVVHPRLHNMPLTPVQSQQIRFPFGPTSSLPSAQSSFNAALPTPRPTQPSSQNAAFISNVQLSQNLGTILPSVLLSGPAPQRSSMLDQLTALRSSAAGASDLPPLSSPYFAQTKEPLPSSSNAEEGNGKVVNEDVMEVEELNGEIEDDGEPKDDRDRDVHAEKDQSDQIGTARDMTPDVNETADQSSSKSDSVSGTELIGEYKTKVHVVDFDGAYEQVEANSVVENTMSDEHTEKPSNGVEEEAAQSDPKENEADLPNGQANVDDEPTKATDEEADLENNKSDLEKDKSNLEKDKSNLEKDESDLENDEAAKSETSDHGPLIQHRRRLTPSDQLEGATPSRIAMRLPKNRRSLQSSTPVAIRSSTPVAISLRTQIGYYTPLSSLPQSFGLTVSLICIAVHATLPDRSKAGPKDYYTTLYITDPSLFASSSSQDNASPVITDSPAFGTRSQRRSTSIQPGVAQPSALTSKLVTAQIFRPHKAALPKSTTADTAGSVILLRDFKVQTLPSGPSTRKSLEKHNSSPHGSPTTSFTPATLPPPTMQLISTASSAWAVFHTDIPAPAPPSSPRKTRSQNTIAVAPSPEVSGPPVEYGDEEIDRVRVLQKWWKDNRDDAEKDVLVNEVEFKVQENEESRRESLESNRGRGRGRGRARVGRGSRKTSRDVDAVHELRDGTRWRDDGKEAVGDGSGVVHELRDGTT